MPDTYLTLPLLYFTIFFSSGTLKGSGSPSWASLVVDPLVFEADFGLLVVS